MKANRRFVNAEEAVSPVIAVILMVAITVVLAATVFVLVSDIGANTSQTQPSVGWSDSEVEDTWNVNQAPAQVTWEAYQLKSNSAAPEIRASIGQAGTTDLDVGTDYETLPSDWSTMHGGDVVTFCGVDTNAGDALGVKVTLLHIDSNSVAHEYTFQTLGDC